MYNAIIRYITYTSIRVIPVVARSISIRDYLPILPLRLLHLSLSCLHLSLTSLVSLFSLVTLLGVAPFGFWLTLMTFCFFRRIVLKSDLAKGLGSTWIGFRWCFYTPVSLTCFCTPVSLAYVTVRSWTRFLPMLFFPTDFTTTYLKVEKQVHGFWHQATSRL